MALFADSTQRHCWLFPAARLAELRAMGGAAEATPPHGDDNTNTNTTRRLFPAEAAAVRVHFETKIVQLCSTLDAPGAVEATAVAYFKRVYLRADLLDRGPLRPQHAALACIYLAAKVEEDLDRVSLGSLARQGGVAQDAIVRSELAVLEALSFQVTVFHPFRSLDALLCELPHTLVWGAKLRRLTKRRKPPAPVDVMRDRMLSSTYTSVLRTHAGLHRFVRRRALQLLKRSYFTDAMFLYTPAQIALGCLVAACRWPGTGADVPDVASIEMLKYELQLFVEGYFREPRLLRASKEVGDVIRAPLPGMGGDNNSSVDPAQLERVLRDLF